MDRYSPKRTPPSTHSTHTPAQKRTRIVRRKGFSKWTENDRDQSNSEISPENTPCHQNPTLFHQFCRRLGSGVPAIRLFLVKFGYLLVHCSWQIFVRVMSVLRDFILRSLEDGKRDACRSRGLI
ncbi:hypothetical protein P3L10_031244 [Capsicum annuum]